MMGKSKSIWLLAAIAFFAALWSLWLRKYDAARNQTATTQTAAKPEPERAEPPRHQARAARPAQERPERPRLSSTRIEIDRSPMYPDETELTYGWRRGIIDGFDAFRAQTGISEERAQEVLYILYEYQENSIAFAQMRERTWKGLPHPEGFSVISPQENLMLAFAQLREVLTKKETQIWRRTVPGAWFIYIGYPRRLLHLIE